MAFSTATGHTNSAVAAMAISSEAVVSGAASANTVPGLYTSQDAGQTWSYNSISDPGGAIDAQSATSAVYNSGAGLFFAAIRYHGFYSSPDGVTWTRLANQPGGSLLSTSACPPQSTSNAQTCPIFRAEITTVPNRNEMYVWFVYYSAGELTDGGIWQSLNGGASPWTPISDSGITNCGDTYGCGIEQGSYNLELLATANGPATDLYAGSINLYKCSINTLNPTCASSPFINLTHSFGCDPISAPAHVHPAQHALAYTIPTSGSESGYTLMYFANDGGLYRALDGVSGLNTGSCSGTNAFDDLNPNLGSMTQFLGFSEHPSDANTLLGGAQDNGSPATNQATTSSAWGSVLGGDGAYTAIDPNAEWDFYASNPDIPPGGLAIQFCSNGVNCNDSSFAPVITSDDLGGDDGAFDFPYILDSQSSSTLLVGTCRLWRGPRGGGSFNVLSPNFDTLGSGTCSGSEVNQVRAIAAGGPTDLNGSTVVYATTNGYGPLEGPETSPSGGHVWVTTNASAGPSSFADTTSNGPHGSINSNQFPISSVAIDTSDASGQTAYITVMGFTEPPGQTQGPGHVWKTATAGRSWIDFTGNLPDSPTNAVVVDSSAELVYVGTDVGVFVSSSIGSASWTEVGPISGSTGFLPNAAVTALALFNSGGRKLLRASTYGRGIWQYDLVTTPDYQLAISNSPLTAFSGQSGVFDGTATAVNGYASSVTLDCVTGTGATAPPSTCSISPEVITPGSNTPFTVTVGGTIGTYNFNVQGVGADPDQITQSVPVTFNVVAFALTPPSPAGVSVQQGGTSSAVSFQVTAAGSFNQSVTLSCSDAIANATCNFNPSATVTPTSSSPANLSVTVTVPDNAPTGNYPITIQATAAGISATMSTSFTLTVTAGASGAFTLAEPVAFPEVNAGSTGTQGPISITAQSTFSGTVTLSCSSTYGAGTCSISPASVSTFPTTATLTINGTNFSAGAYSVSVTGTSGSLQQALTVPFNVGDYSISGSSSVSAAPGRLAVANLTLTSLDQYSGKINITCTDNAPAAPCAISAANPISVSNGVTTVGVSSGGTTNFATNVNVPSDDAPNAYNITINTQDATGTPSHSYAITLAVTPDFVVSSSTTSQTVNPGQTAGPYNLVVQPVGTTFTSPVTLSCSGLPAGAQCSFNPSGPVTPGNNAVDVVMTISTSSSTPDLKHRSLTSIWLLLPGLMFGAIMLGSCKKPPHRRNVAMILTAFVLLPLAFILLSCAGVSGGGKGGGNCAAAPTVPSNLTASNTTGTSTTLNWSASSATVGCSVAYTVYEGINGASPTPLANTTTNTNFVISGLTAQTKYTFAVAAADSFGTSATSSSITVTTTGAVYTITVTGTSPGTPSDPGQSTQVALVVN
jgi:Fibronectin type III domain